MAKIGRFANAQAAADACAGAIFEALDAARRDRGAATLAVSGGSTPRLMFQTMAKSGFDWSHIDLFQVDERCVPPDHQMSNFRMTREALLDHIHLAPGQIHRDAMCDRVRCCLECATRGPIRPLDECR